MASGELSLRKKVVFSFVVLFVFFGVAEIAVRGWVYYLRENYTRYETTTGQPYLVPGEHGRSSDPVVINRDGFVGEELQPDGPDLFRIVALGDSNTFGHGSRSHAYPAVLGRMLAERDRPGRRYEVVNAGIEGLDSHQALYRLRAKVVDLEPDVVVIYIGWNDLMKFDPLGQSGRGAASALSRFVDRLWLVKGIRKLVFVYLRPRIDPPLTGASSLTNRFERFRPGSYIENLHTMIREIREIGAEPVLMTLATVVRPDDTAEMLVDAGVFFPYYPSAYAVGDFLVLVDAYNRAVAEVAAMESVPVVDLKGYFEARPDYRSLFFDTMHPTRRGYELVAENVLHTLDASGLLDEGGATGTKRARAGAPAVAPVD